MALPSNFLDELRARTPIAAVIGRTVKLARSGRQSKGCCPFHAEKTPSFYVYEEDFHCFGCGAHGDVITFVMKSTGAGFMEVVEDLARQAGLDVPKASPREVEAEQRRAAVAEVLEAAGEVYQKWLFASEGRPALEYLRGRGLTEDTIRRFELGWSGEGRGALAAALRGKNIKPDQLVEAGLMKLGEHGPVDMFFSRVMFPIRDRRGSLISFGGRILGEGQPKYVNGPETTVFSKRRSLYGLNLAREAVRKGAPLIVVEGYMDVIALSQAGFGGAVAPLGTALTEEHLAEVWRLSPAPIICFDADNAGRRAALKTADLALAALAPDRFLKFLRLPENDDPDSLIRREGPRAFGIRLDTAQPISAALYDMLAEGTIRSTPETQAIFQNRLEEAAKRIPDGALAQAYKRMLLQRFFAEQWQNSRVGGKAKHVSKFDPSSRLKIDPEQADNVRCFILTATFISCPLLFPDLEEAFARLPLPQSCERMRCALADYISLTNALDTEGLFTHLTGLGLAQEASQVVAVAAEHFRPGADQRIGEIVQEWWSWYHLMRGNVEMLRSQRNEDEQYWLANPDDAAAAERLIRSNERLMRALAGEFGDPDA